MNKNTIVFVIISETDFKFANRNIRALKIRNVIWKLKVTEEIRICCNTV